jgi:G3E family GTPase
MYVYILGGFLGSGKTSLMLDLTSMYIDRGQKVALLVNESGKVGVDGITMKREGYDAIDMPNGCICCTLASSLQNGLRNIAEDIKPDIILIEPTGLALPHRVKDLVRIAMIDEKETIIIGVVDIQRFDDLILKKTDFFKRQMHECNFILINKSDLSTPERLAEVTDWLASEYPDKPIYSISVTEGTNMDKVHELMK